MLSATPADEFPKDPSSPLAGETTGTVAAGLSWALGNNFSPTDYCLNCPNSTAGIVNLKVFDNYLKNDAGSISLWIRASNPPYGFNQFYLSSVGAGTNRFYVAIQNVQINVYRGTVPTPLLVGSAIANTWYHITLTWNSTNMWGYINGAGKVTQAYTGVAGGVGANTQLFGNGGSSSPDNGDIFDVRFWNRCLSDAEVLEVSKGNNVFSGLIGWYRLDEGTGTTVKNYAERILFSTGEAQMLGLGTSEELSDEEFKRRVMSKIR